MVAPWASSASSPIPSAGAPETGVMVVGSLTGASRTVEVLPLTSTHATSSPAALNVTTPLTLPASRVGAGTWPPLVGSVTSHPSSAVGTYGAAGVAEAGEVVGEAAPDGDVNEADGDAVAPGPAWPATSAAGRKAAWPPAASTTPDAEPPTGNW